MRVNVHIHLVNSILRSRQDTEFGTSAASRSNATLVDYTIRHMIAPEIKRSISSPCWTSLLWLHSGSLLQLIPCLSVLLAFAVPSSHCFRSRLPNSSDLNCSNIYFHFLWIQQSRRPSSEIWVALITNFLLVSLPMVPKWVSEFCKEKLTKVSSGLAMVVSHPNRERT